MPITTPIKTGAFISSSKRLTEFTKIRSTSITLLKYKKDRIKLDSKFQSIKDKFQKRQEILDRENAQEQNKKKTLKSKLQRKTERALGGGLFDILISLAKLKILLWASDPKNVKALQGLFEFFKGLFKVIDFFATIGVEGLLGGLGDLVSPESTNIQRLFAVLKIFGGFFILSKLLRWSNPFNAIKDIQKNKGIISRIFKSLASKDFKSALDGVRKLLTPQIFRKGLGQSIQRVILKVFGKGGLKAVQSLATKLGFKTAQQLVKTGISKSVGAIAKKIPLVGPFIGLGINLLMGTPLDVSLVRFAGAAAGEWIGRAIFGILGAILGSIIPGAGTALGGAAGLAVGGIIGNLIGEWISDLAYGWFKSLFGGKKKEEPALAVGGIVTQPTRALIGEAGPEAVIPLGQIYNGTVLNAPFGIVASAMIGSIDALITSMGPVGLAVKPFASQLLSPYTREFGKTNYAFSSDLAKKSGAPTSVLSSSAAQSEDAELAKIVGSGLSLNLLQKKEPEKQERYNKGNSVRELLADILNNIINLDFTSPTTGGGGGGGGTNGGADQALTAAELDTIKASSADKRAAAHLATLEATAPQHVADVYQVILNRAAGQSGGIASVITAKEQFTPYSAALYGSSADKGAQRKYGGLGLTKKELFELAGKPDGIQQLTNRFQAGNPKVAAQVISDFEKNGPLSKNAKQFVGGAQYFLGYEHSGARRRPDGGNWFRDKYQTGGVVQTPGVVDTGPGYTIQGASDQQGRPVVFSQAAANAFAKMMKDSGGVVRPSDVASSKRSPKKNSDVGGANRSKHLYGIAMDIHGSSNQWIRKYGAKYGWIANDYSGSHGGHFEFRGEGIQPSDVSPQNQESQTGDTASSSTPDYNVIAKGLGDLYNLLNPSQPRVDSQSLSRGSMDFIQASKMQPLVSDTYIVSEGSTVISSLNVMTPLPQIDYSMGAYSQLDSSTYLAQRRL